MSPRGSVTTSYSGHLRDLGLQPHFKLMVFIRCHKRLYVSSTGLRQFFPYYYLSHMYWFRWPSVPSNFYPFLSVSSSPNYKSKPGFVLFTDVCHSDCSRTGVVPLKYRVHEIFGVRNQWVYQRGRKGSIKIRFPQRPSRYGYFLLSAR